MIATTSETVVCVGQVCRVSVMFGVRSIKAVRSRAVYGARNCIIG